MGFSYMCLTFIIRYYNSNIHAYTAAYITYMYTRISIFGTFSHFVLSIYIYLLTVIVSVVLWNAI